MMKLLLHVDLLVQDLERALGFYRDLLGFTLVEQSVVEGELARFMSRGAVDRYRLALLQPSGLRRTPGGMVELIELLPREDGPGPSVRYGSTPPEPLPSLINLSIYVEDLEATLAQLRQAGVQPASDTFTVELGRLGRSRLAFVRDPDGNLVELVSA